MNMPGKPSRPLDRRTFLSHSFAVGAGLAGASLAGSFATSASAIQPIARNGVPKFKFSLAAYSYRELFKKDLTLKDFIDDCAKFQLEGTELTSYFFPKETTPQYLRTLKDQAFRLGLSVSGTAVGNDFCHPAGETRHKQIALVKQWVDNSAIMGAPVIRVFSGNVKKGMTDKEARSLAISAIEECCEYAGERGVYLALENHGGLTENVDSMLQLVRDVKSPWFGVNLDSGNFHGEDIYGDLAKIAPYTVNAQIKVTVSGPDKKKIASDYKKLAKIMRDANYRGFIVLEFEEKGNPREECPKELEKIREAFA